MTVRGRAECTDVQAAALEMVTGAPPSPTKVCAAAAMRPSTTPTPNPNPSQVWQVSPSPSPSPNLNHSPHPDSDQVARLQRELYRERWIMEREQAVVALELAELASGSESEAGAPGSGQRRRRSTNIGHRFGSGRGPMVLKATLHQGDVNTRVSVLRIATPVSSVAPDFTHAPLPLRR